MNPPSLLREILLVAAYNTAIAAFLTALTPFAFQLNLVYAQCIGFAIYAGVRGSCLLWRQDKPGWFNGMLGIPAGFAVGFTLASWLTGHALVEVLQSYPQAALVGGAAALIFGILGTWHFHDEGRVRAALAEAQAERLARAEQEAAAIHAELARLQAQIEPHFLFNTLSNVVSLIDTDPAAARAMLLDLTALLRTALARTRQREVTLGAELDLLRAYLGIMARRMGERLAWEISVDDALRAARLPPLLVQPLVENAIRHGLEPRTAGGHLAIRCRRDGDSLIVDVEDDGPGFAGAGQPGDGTGLSNVRARLAACHGERACLALTAPPGGGVRATLRLPLEEA